MLVCHQGYVGRGENRSNTSRLPLTTSPTPQLFVGIACLVIAMSHMANGSSIDMVDDISSLKTRGIANIALLPASPDCWLEAMQVLKTRHKSAFVDGELRTTASPNGDDDDNKIMNTMTCRWMTSDDQKVLALELSKCHMEDIGRPLFQFQDRDQRDACSQVIYDYNMVKPQQENTDIDKDDGTFHRSRHQEYLYSVASNCLVHLTDTGVGTYTHFFSYVNELCTRLLSETILGMYRQTSQRLAQSSKIAESKIQALIEQQDSLFDRWNEREEHVLNIYDELDFRVQEQSRGIESEIENLHDKLEDERRLRNDEYQYYQDTLAKELEKHREDFSIFCRITRKARSFVQPWSYGLNSVINGSYGLNSVINGFQTIQFLCQGVIYNVCAVLLAYCLTIPITFRWMRIYMISAIMMTLSVEILIVWLGSDEDRAIIPWILTYIDSCNILRKNCSCAIFNFYFIGVCFSTFFGQGRARGQSDGGDEDYFETYEEKTNDDIGEQSEIHSEQLGRAESYIISERSVHSNFAFVRFPPPGATSYSNLLFVTPEARATTAPRLSSDSTRNQYAWNQHHYCLMQYIVTPPPPIGSRESPIIIDWNDKNTSNISNETGTKSDHEDNDEYKT